MGSFSVVNNIGSLNAQNQLTLNQVSLNQTLARLSSGYRINRSGDDPAGLATANSYRSSIAVFSQGERNANEGLSTLQIVDSSLNNISLLLDRMSTLAAQSASGTFQGSRATLNQEFQDIKTEISREADQARIGAGNGTFLGGQSVFVGGVSTAATVTFTSSQAVGSTGLGLGTSGSGSDILTSATATTSIATISTAISTLGTAQGVYGSAQNRLGFAIGLVKSQIVNTSAAESIIRDTNFAQESSNLAKYSILNQSGLASLAQANSAAAGVLALLR